MGPCGTTRSAERIVAPTVCLGAWGLATREGSLESTTRVRETIGRPAYEEQLELPAPADEPGELDEASDASDAATADAIWSDEPAKDD